MLLLNTLKEYYNFVFYELCDPRSKDMFPNGITLILIFCTYLYVSKILGPRLMKNRRPYELKNIILVYNAFQVVACIYIFYEGLNSGWLDEYSFLCQPVDTTNSPNALRMLNTVWMYTIIKLIDMIDTIFFVLKKKDKHISFLHVFHHSMMPVASYICLKYFPNGHATLLGVINCFVHIIMYTYYLIAGLGPQFQKYLWWKKYVTMLQLIQFGIIFVHHFARFFVECAYPKWVSALLCVHSLQFVYMFGNFYIETYIKQKPTPSMSAKNNETIKNNKQL